MVRLTSKTVICQD